MCRVTAAIVAAKDLLVLFERVDDDPFDSPKLPRTVQALGPRFGGSGAQCGGADAQGRQTYEMDAINGTTINTCSGTFYDSQLDLFANGNLYYDINENKWISMEKILETKFKLNDALQIDKKYRTTIFF